jgi:hypothetical protein
MKKQLTLTFNGEDYTLSDGKVKVTLPLKTMLFFMESYLPKFFEEEVEKSPCCNATIDDFGFCNDCKEHVK